MEKTRSISFFIPAFNCAATLKDAVESILKTNFLPNDELIIVNDGSTDTTADVLSELSHTYAFIKIIHHSRNKGGGAARNTAVEAGSNDLLFCLDSDNVLAAYSIAPLKQYLLHTQADVASFQQTQYFSKIPGLTDEIWTLAPGEFSKQKGLAESFSPGAGGNYLFTKTSWMRAGGYPEFTGALDTWGFGMRQLMTGSKVMVLENSYYYHRRLPGSYFLRDAWSRKKSISLRVTQLLIPFFDQIEDADIDYILDKKYRYTWFDRIEARPLRLVSIPKKDPVFENDGDIEPKLSLTMLISKVKGRIKRFIKKRSRGQEVSDIGSNGERLALEKRIIEAEEPLVVFDIGANVGDYTQQVLELAAMHQKKVEIHVFEPQQFNARILHEKFAGLDHVIINECGLSDKEETLPIFSEETGSSLASLYNRGFFKEQNYAVSSEEIKLVTLAAYIKQKSLTKIDFMKIDVEGHELAVISGIGNFIKSGLIRSIQFEYGGAYLDAGTRLEDVYKILSPYYTIGIITRDAVVYTPFVQALEDFNYSNYLAVLKTEEQNPEN